MRLQVALALACVAWGTTLVVAASPQFEDRAADFGLEFQHISPISQERHLHLFMGSGLGWFDFDRDGTWDLVFCQGSAFDTRSRPAAKSTDAKLETPVSQSASLPAIETWRGSSEKGPRFQNISQPAGFRGTGHAMGVSIGDYDNDGFADLFVTGFFVAAVYRNNGDGTFTDRTVEANIVPRGFGTGCCWFDMNRDGNLDLLYVRYVKLDPDHYPLCTVPYKGRDVPISCNPKRFAGDTDSVYLNLGDGRFQDVTESSGFSKVPPRHGLGCVALDLDDDGNVELYVANDGMPNDLWKQAKLQFEERGMLSGVAVNRFGAAEAGMGVAAGDIDGDLRPDLFVTNYYDETNTLYRNEGELVFLDVTEEMGIAAPSRKRLGFGVTLADFDNDGWPDLFVANGHVQDTLPQVGMPDQTFEELPQILMNRQGRKFEDVSPRCGRFFLQPTVARGSAAADVDSDGRVDLAVLRLNGRVAFLQNKTADAGHWVSFELLGTESNRDGIGATVIVRSKSSAWRRDRMSSASYLSCDSPFLHFGLGATTVIDSVHVRWPSGKSEIYSNIKLDRLTRLIEGRGSPSKNLNN